MSPIRTASQHRRIPALTAAIALGGTLSLVPVFNSPVTPAAQAQQCSTPHKTLQGDLKWGVKQSFQNYVRSPAARGTIEPGGTNVFTFPVQQGYVDNAGQGFAQGSGTVSFTGHSGLLRTVISNPTLEFTGPTSAKLLVQANSQNTNGEQIDGLDGAVHFADVNFADSITNGGTVTGTTTLTAEGAKAMSNFYDAGTQMDDIELSVSATDNCGTPPSPRRDNATSNNGGNATGSSLPGSLDSLLNPGRENQTSEQTNEDQKSDGDSPASTSTKGNSPKSPAITAPRATTPAGHNAADSQPAPKSGATSGAHVSQAPATGTADQCTNVQSSKITWGLKRSFRSYISSSLAKGGWSGDGVGESGGEFLFSGSDGSVDPNSKVGAVNTRGSLQFTGHDGKLNINISSLRATFNGNSGQLIADVQSSKVDGEMTNYGTVTVATLSYDNLTVTDSSVEGTAQATLTDAGADAFASFYEGGTQLDPVSISASLGGNADCSAANVSGATSSSGAGAGGGPAAALAKVADASKGAKGSKKAGNASQKFSDKAKGKLRFHDGNTEETPDITNASATDSTLSVAQLVGLAAVFAITAGGCLLLSYKRQPKTE